nr:autotransporter-associated beta strand repeat-containing protein [Sphingomonas sp. dw_22]
MTFDGTVTGDGGLTKSGTATLTLNAANSYAGGTTITAGTLLANAAGALPTGGAVAVNGGTLKLGAGQSIGALGGTGDIQLNGQNLGVDIGSGTSRFDGDILGEIVYAGSWAVDDGPVWVTNPAIYSGQEAAALLFGGNASDYAISTVSNNISDINHMAWGDGYGVFQATAVAENYKTDAGAPGYNESGDFSTYVRDHSVTNVNYAFASSGAGSLTKTGDGTLILGGSNTYGGTTRVDGGTLAVDGGRAISDTAAVAVGGAGTFEVIAAETVGSLSGGGHVVLDQTLTTGGDNGSTTYSGAISGAGGLVKTGTGTLTLASANSYAGGTTIDGGTLVADIAGALATGGDVTMTGGTLKLGASQNIGALSGAGAVDLGNSTLSVNVDSGTTRFDGSISGAAGSIEYAGSWQVDDGPSWDTNPAVLSGQEAAALLFGGDAGDYAISTVSNNASDINHMAWGDTYAGPILTVAEDYKVDEGAPGYSQTGDFSTYVRDHLADNVNYAFLYSPAGGLTKTGDGTLILGASTPIPARRRSRAARSPSTAAGPSPIPEPWRSAAPAPSKC